MRVWEHADQVEYEDRGLVCWLFWRHNQLRLLSRWGDTEYLRGLEFGPPEDWPTAASWLERASGYPELSPETGRLNAPDPASDGGRWVGSVQDGIVELCAFKNASYARVRMRWDECMVVRTTQPVLAHMAAYIEKLSRR